MNLIDSHCHLDAPEFAGNVERVLQEAREAGVNTMILPGVTHLGWKRLFDICLSFDNLYAAPGIHPLFLPSSDPAPVLAVLEKWLDNAKTVAIGEIGLDYYPPHTDRDRQQQLFEAQVDLGARYRLPILLHVRKAHDQVLSTLRRKHFRYGGIVHAFGGSLQQANQYIKLGFGIGIGGTVTYDRARKIRAVAAAVELDSLVLETDSPDLAPAAHRDSPNLPKYLPEIARQLARLRGETTAAIADCTTANCCRLLRLQGHTPEPAGERQANSGPRA
ncbi:TatD family hydrolase [Desulforhopalus singaporensis]|uniref:TatD DNase family protein n=1 Tax=Desulforhopalus singaporensis TaxID=91360 RepID=A0A1H0S5C4_9BACT|nr:TatD family hydrolase [Desulforhopalus singaporensis]SDP36952.1 TatD DNase family protein [Desulforhopalus singaporensis]